MDIDLAEDYRQRVADVVAVTVLTELTMRDAEPDFSRLGAMVSTYCAAESPETLQKYSAMDWQRAIREIKIAFAKHYLAARKAGLDDVPPPAVDEQIGKCLVAAFFKFVTYRSINPDWYAPHLDRMRVAAGPMPSA